MLAPIIKMMRGISWAGRLKGSSDYLFLPSPMSKLLKGSRFKVQG
jgi:hypothetical protein